MLSDQKAGKKSLVYRCLEQPEAAIIRLLPGLRNRPGCSPKELLHKGRCLTDLAQWLTVPRV
jgi:hypothetical protein